MLFAHTVVTLFIYARMLLSRRKRFFVDLVYTNYTGFYIINIIDYFTQSSYHTSLVAPADNTCCQRSHIVLHNDTYNCAFFSHPSTSFKIFAVPSKTVFLWFFVHVLLSSQSRLLQYTSESQLILHLMHLQLPGLQSLPSCPTFLLYHL